MNYNYPQYQNKRDIASILFEDRYVDEKILFENTVEVIHPESVQNPEHILSIFDRFFDLPIDEQKSHLNSIDEIMKILSKKHLPDMIFKLFPDELNQETITKNLEIYIIIFANVPKILCFLIASSIKEHPIENEADGTKKSKKNSGVFSQDLHEKFKHNLFYACELFLNCAVYLKLTRVSNIFEKISESLSIPENDTKLLLIIIPLLLEQEITKQIVGLELTRVIVKNLSPNYIEGFVLSSLIKILLFHGKKEKLNYEVRYAGYLCLLKIIETSEIDVFYDKIAFLVEDLFKQSDAQSITLILKNISFLIEKMRYDFVRTKLLPLFFATIKSSKQVIKIAAIKNLHRVVSSFLVKNSLIFNQESELLTKIYKYYFNLEYYTRSMESSMRNILLEENYQNIAKIARLQGNKINPYLKFFFQKTDKLENMSSLHTIKLSIASHLGTIAQISGQEFVEKELIYIVDKQFLTLSSKTTQEIKMKAIQELSKILKITTPITRRFFADYYICIQDNIIKWRIRASICEQLNELIEIFEPADILSFIVPMFFTLCRDQTALVRKIVTRKYYLLVQKIEIFLPEHICIIFDNMCRFATEKTFTLRQSFIEMFANLFLNRINSITKEMKEHLLSLSNDPVSNIRITISLFIVKCKERNIKSKFLHKIIDILRLDKNKDVQEIIKDFSNINQTFVDEIKSS